MNIEIRTYGSEQIELCPHITITRGRKVSSSDEHTEYIQTLELRCEVCKEEHSIEILVN